MSIRKKRLERIVSLRGKLHERSVLALQMAHAEVAEAERDVVEGQQRTSAYRADQMTAIADGEHERWLLARSAAALSSSLVVSLLQNQRMREQVVIAATQHEARLRCELRQVERVMTDAAYEERLFADRREQQQLEEIARLTRASRSKLGFPLEVA